MATIRVYESFYQDHTQWWWDIPLSAADPALGGRLVEPYADSQIFSVEQSLGPEFSQWVQFEVAGDDFSGPTPTVSEIDFNFGYVHPMGEDAYRGLSMEDINLSLDEVRKAAATGSAVGLLALLRDQLRGDDVVYMGESYGAFATYEGDDVIYAGAAGGHYDAGEGNDLIDGSSSGLGDASSQTFIGGAGNDTFIVQSVQVTVVEEKAGGTDLLQIADPRRGMKYVMAANVDNAELVNATDTNVTGNAIGNVIKGNAARNALYGAGGADTLRGMGGDDVLHGGNGSDVLYGGTGRDKLTGGAGADRFVFDTKADSVANRDLVTDFASGVDRLALSAKVFVGIGVAGGVPGSAFHAGEGVAVAHDADDRLLYDTASGLLRFDKDGTGVAAAVVVAQIGVDAHPMLSAGDFLIVA